MYPNSRVCDLSYTRMEISFLCLNMEILFPHKLRTIHKSMVVILKNIKLQNKINISDIN